MAFPLTVKLYPLSRKKQIYLALKNGKNGVALYGFPLLQQESSPIFGWQKQNFLKGKNNCVLQ